MCFLLCQQLNVIKCDIYHVKNLQKHLIFILDIFINQECKNVDVILCPSTIMTFCLLYFISVFHTNNTNNTQSHSSIMANRVSCSMNFTVVAKKEENHNSKTENPLLKSTSHHGVV